MSTSEAEYDVIVVENVKIPMRDSVKLLTDIYRPAKFGQPLEDKLPVILERTPYGKGQELRATRCRGFASKGYIVISQDCRGCHDSGGELYFLAQEPNDGYDTVKWISEQAWCNGKIGTFGTSYGCWTQSALATQNPPQLSTMFLHQGGSNAHTSSVRQGGAMELRFIAWGFWHSALNTNSSLKHSQYVDEALSKADFRNWLKRMPIRKGQPELKVAPNYENWVFDVLTTADYTSFWKQPGFAINEFWDEHPDIPIYFSGGWYDSYTRSTLDNYIGLSKIKSSKMHLIMGPWTHGTDKPELSFAGDVEFGKKAALDSFDMLHLSWFDHSMKGKKNNLATDLPVKIFVMGGGDGHKTTDGKMFHGGHWRYEKEWPLTRAKHTKYYLSDDYTIGTSVPKKEKSCTTYEFDPSNPVPTIGAGISSLATLKPLPKEIRKSKVISEISLIEDISLNGAFDQKESPQQFGCNPPYLPLGSRSDVLVFETKPLENNTEITGPIEVNLWISSSAIDTDFTAKLIDSYPPSDDYPEGYNMNLSDSIARARYRKSREKPSFLTPGEIIPLQIVLYPTSNLFAKGHKIRLDISSSNFPRFDVNPNTGEPIALNRKSIIAENTIYHEKGHPSCILLPIIPTEK